MHEDEMYEDEKLLFKIFGENIPERNTPYFLKFNVAHVLLNIDFEEQISLFKSMEELDVIRIDGVDSTGIEIQSLDKIRTVEKLSDSNN